MDNSLITQLEEVVLPNVSPKWFYIHQRICFTSTATAEATTTIGIDVPKAPEWNGASTKPYLFVSSLSFSSHWGEHKKNPPQHLRAPVMGLAA
jgi:hypothetical protein